MKPRINATATAIPTAADRKFCTVSPSIWVRWLIVVSPPYDCQFVLVPKLTAVFSATFGSTAGIPAAFSGSQPWSRWSAYTNRIPIPLKIRNAAV